MTKEEIITGLKAAAKPEEEYFMDDELIDAINQYPEPFELVEPINIGNYRNQSTGRFWHARGSGSFCGAVL